MAGQIIFAIVILALFAIWQTIKPGKSIFDK